MGYRKTLESLLPFWVFLYGDDSRDHWVCALGETWHVSRYPGASDERGSVAACQKHLASPEPPISGEDVSCERCLTMLDRAERHAEELGRLYRALLTRA